MKGWLTCFEFDKKKKKKKIAVENEKREDLVQYDGQRR